MYSSRQQELVFDWCEKWLKFIELVNETTSTPEPPNDLDELRYWSFRFWFIDHQAEFVQLWGNFSRRKQLSSNQASYIEEGTDSKDMEKHFKNPFAHFYEPNDLYELAHQLDLQCGIDIWEPSEHRASMMRPTLVRMGEMMMEFVNWITERACKLE